MTTAEIRQVNRTLSPTYRLLGLMVRSWMAAGVALGRMDYERHARLANRASTLTRAYERSIRGTP